MSLTLGNRLGSSVKDTQAMYPNNNKYLQSLGIEAAGNVATDAITTYLGWAPPAYAAANFISGVGFNIYAQRYRGEKGINLGEAFASGAVATIPFMNPAAGRLSKVVGKPNTIQRAIVGGAGVGAGYSQIEKGINEQRLLTGEELLGSTLAGGIGGGVLTGGAKGIAKGATKLSERLSRSVKDLTGLYDIGTGIGKSGRKRINPPPLDNDGKLHRGSTINIFGKTFDDVKQELEEFQKIWGYTTPPISKLKPKYTKSANALPKDINELVAEHSLAFKEHTEALQAIYPDLHASQKLDLRWFPDFQIFNPVDQKIVDLRPRIQKDRWVGTVTKAQRAKEHAKHHGHRKQVLRVLDKHGDFSSADFEGMRPAAIEQWNRMIRDAGGIEMLPEEFELDHAYAVAKVGNYIAGLNWKSNQLDKAGKKIPNYQNQVLNEIVAKGGLLGNDPRNAIALTGAINKSKEKELVKRLKALKHKSAKSFGKFDRNDPSSLQTPEQQKARVNYYLTPKLDADGKPIPRSTPIEEFIDVSNDVNEWAIDQMLGILNKAISGNIKVKPVVQKLQLATKRGVSKTIKPPEIPISGVTPTQYEMLLEIFGGGNQARQDIITLFNRLSEQLKEGMPASIIQPMLLDEITYKMRGR